MVKLIESQTARWKLLTKNYRNEGVALFLGAGVSTGCKLPGWYELICRVAETYWGNYARQTVDALLANGLNLPAIASILESEHKTGATFLERLRAALYQDFPFREVLKTPAKRRALVTFVHTNSTMRAVAAFCATKVSGNFGANPLVHSVITSNVDAVLRTYVRARYGDWLLRTIGSAKHNRRVGRIPTYYMHGFLHFDDAQAEDRKAVPCVFTEGEYFDFFNRPHSVFNYTFLYLLREFHCVFIGASMQDQNIRRLLHYSVAERRGTRSDPRLSGLRHFALLRRSGSAKNDNLTDLSLRLLGTRILWLDTYNEIPARLAEVYGKPAWDIVYC
jgi:hypothetical protein